VLLGWIRYIISASLGIEDHGSAPMSSRMRAVSWVSSLLNEGSRVDPHSFDRELEAGCCPVPVA
jgi:hypothetical protein